MTNYKLMALRIAKAVTKDDLNKLDKSLDRLLEAGVFSLHDWNKLDDMILNRTFKLEDKEN